MGLVEDVWRGVWIDVGGTKLTNLRESSVDC